MTKERATAPRTQREAFLRWHAEFMRLLDVRTGHAHRHRIQPKNAEIEARAILLAHATTRLDKQLTHTEWFGEWLSQLMEQADALAALARQEQLGSTALSRARQTVEQLARKIPGDEYANIDWQYLTVVYRLGPEDSVTDILDHPSRYTHASGNGSVELNKARMETSRLESRILDHAHQIRDLELQSEQLRARLASATGLLQEVLWRGQGHMDIDVIESIHDFFKHAPLDTST